ncbi:MAG TPA: dipeptidase [Kofleriaceae bacterium]|jgi:membrane dipeptidase|nr:dipeptidase [Kofleriaceae bacterium]
MALDIHDARALHDEVCVLDLHADTAKLMDRARYDLAKQHARLPGRLNYAGHVDLPRMRAGGMAGQFFGLWTAPYPERGCAASVHRQLDALDRAIDKHPAEIAWALTAADVRAAKASGRVAALGGIEGGQALEGSLDPIEGFARRGVRYLGLLHFSANAIGAPARGRGENPDQGLTAFGREVVRECERVGIVVDLAHINRRGFFDAMELMTKAPMVTHTGVSGVHAHWRNLDDEQIRAVANKGGAIGIIFAKRFLGGATVEAVVDHILHIVKVAGDDVPALGSDFDGFVVPPEGLEDVAAMPNLTAALSRRGLPLRSIEKILGENVLRVLESVPPSAWLDEQAA